jgi:hypothetical protein
MFQAVASRGDRLDRSVAEDNRKTCWRALTACARSRPTAKLWPACPIMEHSLFASCRASIGCGVMPVMDPGRGTGFHRSVGGCAPSFHGVVGLDVCRGGRRDWVRPLKPMQAPPIMIHMELGMQRGANRNGAMHARPCRPTEFDPMSVEVETVPTRSSTGPCTLPPEQGIVFLPGIGGPRCWNRFSSIRKHWSVATSHPPQV